MIYGINRYWGNVTSVECWPDSVDEAAISAWSGNTSSLSSNTVRTIHHLTDDIDIEGMDLDSSASIIEKGAHK